MTPPGPDRPDEVVAYSRGTTVAFDRARAIRVAVGGWLLVLVVLLVVLCVSAAGDLTRRSRLVQHGRAVTATVTGCVAVASGTGETTYGASCRATYTFAGTTQRALIHGMPQTVAAGTQVAAVVDPARPATLSAAASITGGDSGFGPWIPATATAVVLLASLAVVYRGARRGGARPVARVAPAAELA